MGKLGPIASSPERPAPAEATAPSPPAAPAAAAQDAATAEAAVERVTTPDEADTKAPGRRWLVLGLVAVVVLGLDQLTKWWALNGLDEPVHVLGTLQFRLAYNTGIAFSLATGLGPFVAVLAIAVVVMLVRAGRSLTTWSGTLGLALVIGGATGNLGDRAFRGGDFLHGAVIDFIDLQWWPIFNIADMAVVTGAVLLAWRALRIPEDEPEDEPGEGAGVEPAETAAGTSEGDAAAGTGAGR